VKNKNLIIGVIAVLVVIAIGAFLVVGMKSNKSVQNAMTSSSPAPTAMAKTASNSAGASGSAMSKGAVREFTVEGSSFKFVPNVVTVNQGDTVKLVFKNSGGMHNFNLDAFGVKTNAISGGASETVQFVANKKGNFEFYCSVGNHKAMGMTGTLVVQ
jgi:plastocyanin